MSDDDNVVPIGERKLTEIEKTNLVLNEYTETISKMSSNVQGGSLMAMLSLQGKQLEVLLTLLSEANALDAKEFNRLMRLKCREHLKKLKEAANAIQIATQLPPKPPQ